MNQIFTIYLRHTYFMAYFIFTHKLRGTLGTYCICSRAKVIFLPFKLVFISHYYFWQCDTAKTQSACFFLASEASSSCKAV